MMQVIFTTVCELVRPKHVVPGTLKILQGQIQFTGDPPMDEGAPGTTPDSPAPKTKVSAPTVNIDKQRALLGRPIGCWYCFTAYGVLCVDSSSFSVFLFLT